MTVLDDADAVAEAVATWVADHLRSGGRSVALAGGTTFKSAYERLVSVRVEWGRVTIVFGDERCVAPADPDSNYLMARQALLDRVSPASVLRMPAELGPDAGAAEYERVIERVRPIDIALLGVGPDGHTASLFPGTATLSSERYVEAVRDAPKPPPERVTLTLRTLREARHVLIAATGRDKADAVAQALRGEVPAGMIANAEWVLDKAAASAIPAGAR